MNKVKGEGFGMFEGVEEDGLCVWIYISSRRLPRMQDLMDLDLWWGPFAWVAPLTVIASFHFHVHTIRPAVPILERSTCSVFGRVY